MSIFKGGTATQSLKTTDVEYRHKYDNRQPTTASPEEPQSVTSGLRVSVQPAKPATTIRLLYEELPKVYVFSSHKIFTAFCTPFPDRISHCKILAMP